MPADLSWVLSQKAPSLSSPVLAREVLHESGSVFVQISDENLHHVREIMDEVFGVENFVSQITFSKTSSATVNLLPSTADYILWFGKTKDR